MTRPDAPKTHGSVDASNVRGSLFLGLFLQRRHILDPKVMNALATVSVERRIFEDDEIIVPCGQTIDSSCLLIRGAAIRRHAGCLTGISALCLPGDFMDLHAFPLRRLDHEIVAVGRAVVEFVPHGFLQELVEDHPEVTVALWSETLVDAKMHRTWVIANSTLQASQRIAHLVCELEYRLSRVNLAEGGHFACPLDQKTVATVLGLSAVHVNRAVQELRGTNLLTWDRRSVHLPDIPAIRRFARFDPDYLEA